MGPVISPVISSQYSVDYSPQSFLLRQHGLQCRDATPPGPDSSSRLADGWGDHSAAVSAASSRGRLALERWATRRCPNSQARTPALRSHAGDWSGTIEDP